MLKQKYFLADIFILSAEKQPIKSSWREIEWLRFSFVFPMEANQLNTNEVLKRRRLLLKINVDVGPLNIEGCIHGCTPLLVFSRVNVSFELGKWLL